MIISVQCSSLHCGTSSHRHTRQCLYDFPCTMISIKVSIVYFRWA
jgi:hypothetical protein